MRTLIAAGLLVVIGTATAASLTAAAGHTRNWGELTTPALLVAGLLAWGLGTLAFSPPRRRRA